MKFIPASGVIIQGNKVHVINPGKARVANVAQGFVDSSGVFHPIRASGDYSPAKVGEKKKRATKKRAVTKKRVAKKAKPKKTVRRKKGKR